MAKSRADQLLDNFEKLKKRRDSNWDTHWSELQTYFAPYSTDFPSYKRSDGEEIISPDTSIGMISARDLASYLFAYLNPPGQQWFNYGILNAQDDLQLKRLSDEVSRIAYELINRSNYYQISQDMLRDLVIFGTSIIEPIVDEAKGLLFRYLPLAQCWIDEDFTGAVDTLYRKYSMPKRQLRQLIERRIEAGKDATLPKCLCGSKDDDEKVEIVYAVTPQKSQRGPYDFDYTGELVLVDSKELVATDHYDRFPFIVTRFSVKAGEVYGRSPGMDALPDVRLLNRMMVDYTDATEFAMTPPIFIPDDDSIMDATEIQPGAVIPVRSGTDGKVPVEFMPVGTDLQSANLFIQQREMRVQQAFYLDAFSSLEGRTNMSATEVVERVNEKVQSISSFVSRLEAEYLTPLMLQIWHFITSGKVSTEILDVEDLPKAEELRVSFISPLDSRLRKVKAESSIEAFTLVSQMLTQIRDLPEIKHFINVDREIDSILDSYNMSSRQRTQGNERDNIREEQAQAQQQQQQQAVAAEQAGKIDPTKSVEPNSPASVMGGLGLE